jgi:alpha-beta hydrolase superfamily lysophospholipase
MNPDQFDYMAGDGQKLRIFCWQSGGSPSAVVLIVHGMAEHAERYNDFADFLVAHGITVYAGDLRGHGKTAGSVEETGYFAGQQGWMRVTQDIYEISKAIKMKLPGKPLFLIGHSMGSFIARTCIALHGDEFQGCVLSGTASHPAVLLSAAALIARLQKWFMGPRHRSQLLDKLSFGAYNKRISNPKTKFDWLSRDEKVVDRYIADPFCGFVCTAGFFSDLFMGLKFINHKKSFAKTPAGLPLFLIAGSEDPVGNYNKGVKKVVGRYKAAGMTDITVKFYEGGRHEMLNEIGKEVVYRDLLHWIESKSV